MTNERTTPRSNEYSLHAEDDADSVTPIEFAHRLREAKASNSKIIEVEAGEVIKETGRVLTEVYFIHEGRVDIEHDVLTLDGPRTVTLRQRRKGGALNELAAFGPSYLGLTQDWRYVAKTNVKLVIVESSFFQKGVSFEVFAQHNLGLSIDNAALMNVLIDHYKTQYNYRVTDKDLKITALLERATTLEQQMPPLEASNEQLMEENVEFRSRVDHLEAEAKRQKDEIDRLKATNAKLKQEQIKTARIAFTSLQEDERRSKAIVNISNFFLKLMNRELTLEETDEARRLIAELHPQWTREQATLETSLQDELRKALVAELDGPPTPRASSAVDQIARTSSGAVTVRDIPRVRLQSPPASTLREGTHVPLQRSYSETALAAVRAPEPPRIPSPTFTVKPGSKGPMRSPTIIGTAPASQMPPTKPEGQQQPPPRPIPALPPRPTVERSPHTMRGMPAAPAKAPPSGERGIIPALGSTPTPLGTKAVGSEAPLPETEEEDFSSDRSTLEGLAPVNLEALEAQFAQEQRLPNSSKRPPVAKREVTQRNQFGNLPDVDLNDDPPSTKRTPQE